MALASPEKSASERHWLFGYGSIVNEASRLSTLAAHSSESPPPAAWVELDSAAGFVREWNFRAPSGFTAVGLRRDAAAATQISGVLFEAGFGDALSRFDLRENGYERLELEPSQLHVLAGHTTDAACALQESSFSAVSNSRLGETMVCSKQQLDALINDAQAERSRSSSPQSQRGACKHRFWTYVPMVTNEASEEHPICQTYVDVCISGCLERGSDASAGAALAREWVLTTGGWSHYWLNDAPMSRRPWLHRPRHSEIDAVLREAGAHTQFSERRHPEEFSGRFMGSLRGLWGLPPRNSQFVGRDSEIARVAAAMQQCEGGGLGGEYARASGTIQRCYFISECACC